MAEIRAVSPDGVVAAVVARVDDVPGRVRLAVDGAPAADPHALAAEVVDALSSRRPVVHVRWETYWRPAGQRLEHGHRDDIAWLEDWLDVEALRREVLEPFVADGTVLPALRDPATDRSARARRVLLPEEAVVVVSGSVLLGRGLPFDISVHLRLSPGALERRTPEEEAWTLPALARYAAEHDPEGAADLVVRADDPRHPALVVPGPAGAP